MATTYLISLPGQLPRTATADTVINAGMIIKAISFRPGLDHLTPGPATILEVKVVQNGLYNGGMATLHCITTTIAQDHDSLPVVKITSG